MKGLDGLAFLGPALFLFVGLFAGSADALAINIVAIVGVVGMVSALSCAGYCVRMVMNFADDAGLKRGLQYAAMLMLRGASAFWLWMALALFVLAQVHDHWRDVFERLSIMSVFVAGIVFAIGVAWFVAYAWSKQNVHRPSNR